MKTKIKFLAHQVMLGVISLEDVPEKYKLAVDTYIKNESQKENNNDYN